MTSERQRWLEWRRRGIGGSDAAAIAGLSPYSTPMTVWLSKVSDVILPEDEDEVMRWGRRLEPAIAEDFEDKTGFHVGDRQRLVEHPHSEFMRATIDGMVFAHYTDTVPMGLYEAKSASRRSSDWDDGVPDHVQIQVQHNLAVTGLDKAWVAAFLMSPTPHLKIFVLERDDAAILVLEEMEAEFWERVKQRIPPAADASDRTAVALRNAFEPDPRETVVLDDDQAILVRMWLDAKKMEDEAKKSRLLAENNLMAIMGTATVAMHRGQQVVTWMPYVRHLIDNNLLYTKHPRIAKEVEKVSESRRFIVKAIKKEDENEA